MLQGSPKRAWGYHCGRSLRRLPLTPKGKMEGRDDNQ
jgi:hypothetical protein